MASLVHAYRLSQRSLQVLWLPWLLRLLAIAMGALHTWAAISSYSMNPDGIAYLDMGDAFLRGDFGVAINAYWSPLYAWLLALGTRFLGPTMRWEFPAVQLVNFGIYLATVACFEFFWRQLMRFRRCTGSGDESVTLPEWAWPALGYTLFIWSSLDLIAVWSVTPDMCVAAFVYLAAGQILRIRVGTENGVTYALLGIALGLSYLSKAVMFPLAAIFLMVGLFSVGDLRRGIPGVLVALACFALVAGPFVVAISIARGRPTFGDSGKLNYARYVNGLPDAHWQGDIPDNGAPVHPTRRILDSPAIYEFATPISGTYPPWYDPSYWYEGVVLRFRVIEQMSVLVPNALFYFELFFQRQGGLVVAVLILYLVGQPRPPLLRSLVRRWGLTIPALGALSLYALVYVETRYLGAFIVLLWADLLANVRLPVSEMSVKLASLLSATMIAFLLITILAFNVEGLQRLLPTTDRSRARIAQAGPPSWPGEVAEELHSLGIQQGDKVAVIGYGFDAFWARLARVQIVAEMLEWEAEPFWSGDPALQSQVVEAFASTGAQAIVAENVPGYASLDGWQRVGDSNYYIMGLLP